MNLDDAKLLEEFEDIQNFDPRHLPEAMMTPVQVAELTLYQSMDEPPECTSEKENGSTYWKVKHAGTQSGFLLCVKGKDGIMSRYRIKRVSARQRKKLIGRSHGKTA